MSTRSDAWLSVLLLASALVISACTSASGTDGELGAVGAKSPRGTNKNIDRSLLMNRDGDVVGGMQLTTGTLADTQIFYHCDPVASVPGVYERTCTVPPVHRLRIGGGWLARSALPINFEWGALSWTLSLDGHQIDLQSFGTMPDRTIVVDGVEMTLREWNVVLVEPTPGTHTLHQVIRQRIPLEGGKKEVGTYDMTWVFSI